MPGENNWRKRGGQRKQTYAKKTKNNAHKQWAKYNCESWRSHTSFLMVRPLVPLALTNFAKIEIQYLV